MKKTVLLPAVIGTLALLGALLAWHGNERRPPASTDTATRPRPSSAPITTTSPDLAPSPASAPQAAADHRLLLERRCLALADHDPLAAMELALKNNLCADDPGLLASLMMQWASRDFDAACEWTKNQPPDAWRNDIVARLAYIRAKADPIAGARMAVSDISPGPARDEAIISVLHQWALLDSPSARLWAESMPEGPLRQRAVAEVAGIQKTGPQ